MDKKANTYIWATTSKTAKKFEEKGIYIIKASCDNNNRLLFVNQLPESEQPDDAAKKSITDVFDLIYNTKGD